MGREKGQNFAKITVPSSPAPSHHQMGEGVLLLTNVINRARLTYSFCSPLGGGKGCRFDNF